MAKRSRWEICICVFCILVIGCVVLGLLREKVAEPQVQMENADEELCGPIDYEALAKKYTLLENNICINPKSIFEDAILCEYLKVDIEFEEKFGQEFGVSSTMHFFPFDFNDDGLNDYFVCFSGMAWSGSAGDSVRIYVQERDGSVKKVFRSSARVCEPSFEEGYAPVVILEQKTEGYYDFVLPWTENRVVHYNAEKDMYE